MKFQGLMFGDEGVTLLISPRKRLRTLLTGLFVGFAKWAAKTLAMAGARKTQAGEDAQNYRGTNKLLPSIN